MAAALRVADRVHLLARGRIVASGTPEQLVAGSNEQARDFFDSSGVDTRRLLAEHAAALRPIPEAPAR
jgi:ABC-type proline/glycine betaine transport system ATPase subunit